ncbi:MAG: hypothetical protein ACTSWN_12015 [Promethearchaeota archaeon]
MGPSPAIDDVDDNGKLEIIVGHRDYKVFYLSGENGSQEWSFFTREFPVLICK